MRQQVLFQALPDLPVLDTIGPPATRVGHRSGPSLLEVGYTWSGGRPSKPTRASRTIPEDHHLAHFPLPPSPTGGCSDPAFWEMVALDYARTGRAEDLSQAIAACEEGLRSKPEDTTASAWRSLVQTADLMRLRLVRRAQRGQEVRHHPGPAARRKRELRFS